MFLFYYVVLFSRKLSEKILLALGPGFAKIFGSELWVFGTCARLMYNGAVLAYVFALLCGVILPKVVCKNSPSLRSGFCEKFSGANFGYLGLALV